MKKAESTEGRSWADGVNEASRAAGRRFLPGMIGLIIQGENRRSGGSARLRYSSENDEGGRLDFANRPPSLISFNYKQR